MGTSDLQTHPYSVGWFQNQFYPYAAATAFHHNVMLILEDILGYKLSTNGHIIREIGIFGLVDGYVGIVEAQGRGMLHLHLLVWLVGTPSNSEMVQKLQDPLFRQRLEMFISRHIKSHVEISPSLKTDLEGLKLKSFCKQRATAFSRPLNPEDPTFSNDRQKQEFFLAWSHQHHTCLKERCLKKNRWGKVTCKRGAPWPLSDIDTVNSNGEWRSKRQDPNFNTWNPYISFVIRSNNDIKLLLNGVSTRHITFYVTKYAAKRQKRSYNTSALIASRIAYSAQTPWHAEIRKANKRLLSQCANTLTREQELSAQQIVSYLMMHGDRYLSHKYVPIHWRSMEKYLEINFMEFRMNSSDYNDSKSDNESEVEDTFMRLHISKSGITLKSQINDYIFRGDLLDNLNFLDFLLRTYERNHDPVHVDKQRSRRIPYIGTDEAYKDRCRILRREDAEILPDFLGSWLPRNDRPESYNLYCASILALLKPWRNIRLLKTSDISWSEALRNFQASAQERTLNIIANFQFFYQSSDDAEQERLHEQNSMTQVMESEGIDDNAIQPLTIDDILDEFSEHNKTRIEKIQQKEMTYKQNVIDIFHELLPTSDYIQHANVYSHFWASRTTLNKLENWKTIISEFSKCGHSAQPPDIFPKITSEELHFRIKTFQVTEADAKVEFLMRSLNNEQQRVCRIVDRFLKNHLQSIIEPNPMRLLVTGAGGVGKSVVIHAIRQIFQLRQVPEKLAVTATSGIAASHIGGFTLHWWAGIAPRTTRMDGQKLKCSATIQKRRQENILGKHFLIIDEVSMMTLETLAILSRIITETNEKDNYDRCLSFGGHMNVIMFGDFHQFPPVNSKLALYKIPPPSNVWANIGYTIFQEFETVVILHQQMRVDDPEWNATLHHIRTGQANKSDLQELNKLVISKDNTLDITTAPWNSSILVTPRNSIREVWNEHSIRAYCKRVNKACYLCPASDILGKRNRDTSSYDISSMLPLSTSEDQLPAIVEIAEGMPAIITSNISVINNLANGTIGTIERIYLDEREIITMTDNHQVKLQYPPRIILIRLQRYSFPKLPGLDDGVIPVEMAECRLQFKTSDSRTIRITRYQFPIQPAFAITDYRSQSQTINPIIVDIGKPPTGRLGQFNAYVALSRGTRRKNIRLLRGFDESLFMKPIDDDVLKMDVFLEERDKITKEAYKVM